MKYLFLVILILTLINSKCNLINHNINIDNKMLLIAIIAIITYLLVHNIINMIKVDENYADINDNTKILPKIGLCSSVCCPNYYQSNSLPIESDPRIKPEEIGTKYHTSNMSCSDGVRRGCVCLLKEPDYNDNNFLGTDNNKYVNMIAQSTTPIYTEKITKPPQTN